MQRNFGKFLAAILLAAVMVVPAAAEYTGYGVTRDPFAHPDLEETRINTTTRNTGRSPGERIRDEAAGLELRATIHTGDWALANINGTMVEPGEEIEGFTVRSIGEMDAVLVKEGTEVILQMKMSNIMPIE